MIQNVKLHNFKCFKDESFDLKGLTLIAGANGIGKSTLIQSLLLLRQSYVYGNIVLRNSLRFRGDLVNLQSPNDVIYVDYDDNTIGIAITNDEHQEYNCAVGIGATTPDDVPLVEHAIYPRWEQNALFDKDFVYLYADRMIPKDAYAMLDSTPTYSRVGDRMGNNSVFCLLKALNDGKEVEAPLLQRQGVFVGQNVSSWISYILGTQLFVSSNWITPNMAELKYVTSESKMQVSFSPLNMAFGSTYIFPIVLGLLTAPVGSMFIVENPEAHLHPAAQTRMGIFLALAAQSGIQIVVESHSEHLMNGIRLAVKRKEVSSGNVIFYSMDIDTDGTRHKKTITLDKEGELSTWPNGFFDEWEKSLVELIS